MSWLVNVCVLVAVALALTGCDGVRTPGLVVVDDAPGDAGALDAPPVPDTPGTDAPDTPELDAPTDAGCTLVCEPLGDPCLERVGCTCTATPIADGTSCGTHGETCDTGVCTPPAPGCGSGWRDLTPTREGCDDGNLTSGDACSATCEPIVMVLAAPAGVSAFAPRAAADGSGRMLFVWVQSRPPSGPGFERSMVVRGAITSWAGVLEGDPFTIDDAGGAGFGIGQAITPVVAGLADGWVVAWRSTTIEGPDADLGGIAYRLVPRNAGTTGALGRLRQANVEERFDQREPVVVAAGGGFVIAWTDGSDRAADPGLGVRARTFDAAGVATSPAFAVAADPSGDQSQPALASYPEGWAIAFTDSSTGMPTVLGRRYEGTTSLDVAPFPITAAWSSAASIAIDGPTLWTAWLDRGTDAMGAPGSRSFDVSKAEPLGSAITLHGDPAARDDGIAIASRAGRTTLGWRTDALVQGLRLAALGWTFPPEAADLTPLLVGARQRDLSLAPTADGLWLTWTDEYVGGSTSAAVAYLLPWD